VVVITGGGRGLREAYAVAYAQAGASGIVLAARSQDEPDGVACRVPGISPRTKVSVVKYDVTLTLDVENLAKAIREERQGRLDVIVNNAGFLDEAGWKLITESNP
jgi:NAD(P)-dependent dehydrogenase (short-subunit alcohol dehydrogenase family)